MIKEAKRGFNWTNSILGLKANEIHLCGEDRVFKIVASLVKELGDELIVHQYSRLSSIEVEKETLKSPEELKEGDCIIAFTKRDIFKIKENLNTYFNSD